MHWPSIKARLSTYRNPRVLCTDLRTRGGNALGLALDWLAPPRIRCDLCGWCGFSFRALSYGGWRSPAELCPCCQSYPRHRLLAQYLESENLNQKPGIIVDIGAGASLARLFPHPTQLYVKTDLYRAPDVDQLLDIEHLPFRNQSISLLMCLHVLDHVPDDHAAMAEMERVLTPTGVLILQSRVDDALEKTKDYYPARSKKHPLQFRDYGRDYGQRFSLKKLKLSPVVRNQEEGGIQRKETFFIGRMG